MMLSCKRVLVSLILLVLAILSACTDYVKEMDDEYAEWEATQRDESSSSERRDETEFVTPESGGSSADTKDVASSSSVAVDSIPVENSRSSSSSWSASSSSELVSSSNDLADSSNESTGFSSSESISSSSALTASSSSETEKSSASVAKSSSSQGEASLSDEERKYIDAGVGGGAGFATRYWDCCKPHCAWESQTDNLSKTCLANGNIASVNAQSVCDGGSAGICMSQRPIIVSDKLAYAFGVVPNSNGCGKCYALTFTGEGQFKTQGNHQAIKGKTLVVMSIGPSFDGSVGQFDIMIPGGGTGAFNGCTTMGWPKNTGAQFGGLLSDCEKELDYPGDETSRQCLEDRCNSVFSDNSLSEAREGCLFLATWMMAADNPSMTYKEVECPSALINAY